MGIFIIIRLLSFHQLQGIGACKQGTRFGVAGEVTLFSL